LGGEHVSARFFTTIRSIATTPSGAACAHAGLSKDHIEMTMHRFATLLLAAAVSVSAAGYALSETSIKVLVNDEPITNYDIAQRQKLLQLAHDKGGPKDAMEQLIDETIQLQEAKKRGLIIHDKQIDQFFADIAQRNAKLSVAQFTQALGQAGIAPATLKRRIKAQATW